MTAVIYARYSSDNQREESIEGQIRECTAYAEKNGITIVKHYIDRAISAKTDNRPEFQQMIKDSDKKLFDIVLVWIKKRSSVVSFQIDSHIWDCCLDFSKGFRKYELATAMIMQKSKMHSTATFRLAPVVCVA